MSGNIETYLYMFCNHGIDSMLPDTSPGSKLHNPPAIMAEHDEHIENVGCSPANIRRLHLSDELAYFGINGRSAGDTNGCFADGFSIASGAVKFN